ncbi:MAG: hypothetical protein ACRC35_04720 [Angustibacter sp.]
MPVAAGAAGRPRRNADRGGRVDPRHVNPDSGGVESALAGRFVCPDTRLRELADVVAVDRGGDHHGVEPPAADSVSGGRFLSVALVVPAGPAAVLRAVELAAGLPGIDVCSVELPVPDVEDGVASLVSAADRAGVRGRLPVFGEITICSAGAATDNADQMADQVDHVLDRVAAAQIAAKVRTGGTHARAFPRERVLAGFIGACISRGIPFKCTAGLHRAVRHRDPGTGFEHHGFLNVLLATDAAQRGADLAQVEDVLAERSAAAVLGEVRQLAVQRRRAIRMALRSIGSCSLADPAADLVALGLATGPAGARPGAHPPRHAGQ